MLELCTIFISYSGKMLIAGMGYLTGYDGTEKFEIPGKYIILKILQASTKNWIGEVMNV